MMDWGVSRQIYVAATDAQALAETKDAEMWYQDSLRRSRCPSTSRTRTRACSPGSGRGGALREGHLEGLVAETVAFGSPDTVARHIEDMRTSASARSSAG